MHMVLGMFALLKLFCFKCVSLFLIAVKSKIKISPSLCERYIKCYNNNPFIHLLIEINKIEINNVIAKLNVDCKTKMEIIK